MMMRYDNDAERERESEETLFQERMASARISNIQNLESRFSYLQNGIEKWSLDFWIPSNPGNRPSKRARVHWKVFKHMRIAIVSDREIQPSRFSMK